MFQAIREWIVGHQRESFLIGLALVGAMALVLASGFQVEIGQFFAFQCVSDDECAPGQYCSGGGSCIDGTSPDQTTACTPVTAPSWTGGTNACKKEQDGPGVPPIPENFLPHVTLQNTGGLPGIATSAPYGSEDGYTCFEFTIPEGNAWAAFDATSGGTVPAPPGQHTLTGQFFNNCPWQVEMTGGAAGSPVAGNDYIFMTDGTVDEPVVGLDERISRGTTQLIPSCWNYAHLPGGGQQSGCSGTYSITLDLSGFDAGRIEASLGWKHHDQVGTAAGNTTVQDGYNIVANSGRNCTGAAGEQCASTGTGSTGTTGSSGAGPGGTFNCGSGSGSDGCWCGEWTDAIWAQRHANAASQCSPGYVLTPDFKAFLAENVSSFNPSGAAPDGTSDGDIQNWSRGAVQNFIDVMSANFSGGNQGCVPRSSGVDYAGIQNAYFSIGATGIGLSGNGSSAVARLCKDDIQTEPADLSATCQSGPAIRLEWNIPVGAVTNALIKRVDGGDGQFIEAGIGQLTTNYTDNDVEAGHSYEYQHKVHASVASEPVTVVIEEDGTCRVQGAGTSPTPTPTTTGTPLSGTPTPSPGAVCGDGICSGGETPTVCADDCGSSGAACGNGVCDSNESCSSCSVDCGTCSATCGDGVCGQGEGCNNCADDCGTCGAFCGDNICDNSESCSVCSGDCGICGGAGGQVGAAGQTPTGPGAASFLAFMLASVTALLYVSYTHTSLFRRREVQKVIGDDHMDFQA